MNFVSTSVLAKQMNMNQDYLLRQLEKKGLIFEKADKWNLTPAGEAAGGILRNIKGSNDKYIAWPDSIKNKFNEPHSGKKQKKPSTTMDKVTIRVATSQDITRIAVLGKELGDVHMELDDDEFWAPSSFRFEEHISNDDSRVLVAEERETIVSYCLAIITTQPPEFNGKLYGSIKELLVTDSHRGQGIGEKMVHELEQWFRNKGIHRIEVGVAASNDKAAAFWQKMGYSPGLVLRHKEI